MIAKIEKPEVLSALPAIVAAFDGLMVARGDLGVEAAARVGPADPEAGGQPRPRQARPVIVATQMLESMITHSRPTRAEASDVANAILDGADAVMLSAETGVGAHPIEAVAMMDRIIARGRDLAGQSITCPGSDDHGRSDRPRAAEVGAIVGRQGSVAFSRPARPRGGWPGTGPPIPLMAFAEPATRSQLALTWGVETFIVPTVHPRTTWSARWTGPAEPRPLRDR